MSDSGTTREAQRTTFRRRPGDAAPVAEVAARARPRVMTAVILYRDRRWYGGIVAFIELLRDRLPGDWSTEQFVMGRRFDQQCALGIGTTPLRDALGLFRAVRRSNPDVVHVNPSLNLPSLLRDGLFVLVLRMLGKRGVLVFWHGWEAPLAARIRDNAAYRRLFRWVFGWAGRSIVLASRFREDFIHMGFPPGRVSVESTMFDGTLFEGVSRRAHRGVTVLFLSRMETTKGIFELIEAFARLSERFPDARLVMAGEGPARRKLEQRAAQLALRDVAFPGYLRGMDKAQALVDADLFVLPTYYGEGCPVALLEAMGVGLACITNAVGGIPDVFRDGVNGVLLDGVTVESVADALNLLLSDPARCAEIGKHNRLEAWSKYEAGVVAPRIEACYREVAALDSAR